MRAAVMLSVLVGLPAAWVYYGPLPPKAQQVVDRFVAVAKEAVGWQRPAEVQPVAHRGPTTAQDSAPPPVRSLALQPTPQQKAVPAAASAPPTVQETSAQRLARQVEPLLARLRQFGAEEYVLEPWGEGGRLYRFHCEMPLGDTANLTQQFEAVAADPERTIAQVVAEIQTWQLDRRRGGL
jgi:hypothetical protein